MRMAHTSNLETKMLGKTSVLITNHVTVLNLDTLWKAYSFSNNRTQSVSTDGIPSGLFVAVSL